MAISPLYIPMMQQVEQLRQIKQQLRSETRQDRLLTAHATARVGKARWDAIAKWRELDDSITKRLYTIGVESNMIRNETDETTVAETVGEIVYLELRPELIKKDLIFGECSKNNRQRRKKDPKKKGSGNEVKQTRVIKGKKSLGKVEQIRMKNTLEKIKNEFNQTMNSSIMSDDIENRVTDFKSRYVEISIIRMILECKRMVNLITESKKNLDYLEKLRDKYKSKFNRDLSDDEMIEYETAARINNEFTDNIYEMIIGFTKILNEFMTYPNISTSCLDDIKQWMDHAKDLVQFDGRYVIVKSPELIFKTIYDRTLKKKTIGLYQSQQDLFEYVQTNVKNKQPFLAVVRTVMGAGKTSTVITLCGWLNDYLKSNPSRNTKILYCCPNVIVIDELAQKLFSCGARFGIYIYEVRNPHNKAFRFSWAYTVNSHDTDASCIIYLCDHFGAKHLLETRKKEQEEYDKYMRFNRNLNRSDKNAPIVSDYIFIGDELTRDADSRDGFEVQSGFSLTTEIFSEICQLMPHYSILMSATMPMIEEMSSDDPTNLDLYDKILKSNSNLQMRCFSSTEAKIGCALVSSSGELFFPHMGCKTADDIRRVINVIKCDPIIGKFYTFQVLLVMISKFNEIAIDVPDLSFMIDDPSKATQVNIQNTAIVMLESLYEKDSSIIEQACSLTKNIGTTISLNKLLTSDIDKLGSTCLVFSTDPIQTAISTYKENFNTFLDKTSDRDIFEQIRIDKILKDYEDRMKALEKETKRIASKSDKGIIEQNKKNNTKERVKMDMWQRMDVINSNKPRWAFPDKVQIGSINHMKSSGCTKNDYLSCVTPEDMPSDSNVSDDILTLLASGVGIYSTLCPLLDEPYLRKVIELTNIGKIKVIFTDSSVAYGTNLNVSDIIMVDETTTTPSGDTIESITRKHSIKTIFQMFGRAGRGGNLSYEARIYTTSSDNSLITDIRDYINGTLNEGDRNEIKNIRTSHQVLW